MPGTILVVEDDPDLRRLYRLTLALAGFAVQEAADGMEALRRIDQEPPDLVVLDLLLPTVSGVVVYQEIASHPRTRNIPIVVVTGSDEVPPEMPCVLRKPVTSDRLLAVVRECLGAGSAST